jgi:hypothetical protein
MAGCLPAGSLLLLLLLLRPRRLDRLGRRGLLSFSLGLEMMGLLGEESLSSSKV